MFQQQSLHRIVEVMLEELLQISVGEEEPAAQENTSAEQPADEFLPVEPRHAGLR